MTEIHEYARRLFGRPAEVEEVSVPDPANGNHVPDEGSNPRGEGSVDMADFARKLFEGAHRD